MVLFPRRQGLDMHALQAAHGREQQFLHALPHATPLVSASMTLLSWSLLTVLQSPAWATILGTLFTGLVPIVVALLNRKSGGESIWKRRYFELIDKAARERTRQAVKQRAWQQEIDRLKGERFKERPNDD